MEFQPGKKLLASSRKKMRIGCGRIPFIRSENFQENHCFFIYVLVIRRRHLLIYYTNTVFTDKAIHCRYATGICGSGEIPRQSGWPRATAEGLRNLCQTYRPNFSGRSGSRSTGTRRGSTIACAYICAYTYAP